MSLFSERFGYEAAPLDLPESDMPKSLRDGLWDAVNLYYIGNVATRDMIGQIAGYTEGFSAFSQSVWFSFLRESIDQRSPNPVKTLADLRERFYLWEFHVVYSFVEFAVLNFSNARRQKATFTEFCNLLLSRERAAFRFAAETLVRVSDEISVSEIAGAISHNKSDQVKVHVMRAAELYSQMPNPDYRNSIKESISAVEAAVSFVSGAKPSGISKPLKSVIDVFVLHPALRDGFEKLYAYTSDSDGIRHALMGEQILTQADARYMLVSCSAFSNYLVAKFAEGTK